MLSTAGKKNTASCKVGESDRGDITSESTPGGRDLTHQSASELFPKNGLESTRQSLGVKGEQGFHTQGREGVRVGSGVKCRQLA